MTWSTKRLWTSASSRAHLAGQALVLDRARGLDVTQLGRGQVAQQLARARVCHPRGGLHVEAAGVGLYPPRLATDRLDAARDHLPRRLVARRPLDVLAPDLRDVLAGPARVEVDERAAVPALFLGHVVEHAGAVGVFVPQTLGEVGVGAAVLFLVGDRQGEHFLLGEV